MITDELLTIWKQAQADLAKQVEPITRAELIGANNGGWVIETPSPADLEILRHRAGLIEQRLTKPVQFVLSEPDLPPPEEPEPAAALPFDGWDEPVQNWSRLPHAMIEALPLVKTGGELKVILYILRHTWGWGDAEKRISLDEFQHGRKRKGGERFDPGTGLSRNAVRRGLRLAIEHGFIEEDRDTTDPARIRITYKLRARGVQK